uniref:Polyprotein protein n=1 Tax=Solanum tuberosum TaxID=4113 RepID=M1DAY6_SOLTU
MSMIFEIVDIPNVPTKPDMPPATTGDDVRVEEAADPESEAETDEKILGVAEEASYEGLTNTEEAIVDAVMQISLSDTPLAAPSGDSMVSIDVTPGTNALVQSTTSGTDAQTDGAIV